MFRNYNSQYQTARMKEICRKQNSEMLPDVKKMEYLNSLKLEEKALSFLPVKVKPKMVTRLLRNRVVLEEIDAGTELGSNVLGGIQKEVSAISEKDREIAEWKILDLALANNVSMDVIKRKVLAFSPVVKVERQILVPYRSERTPSPEDLKNTDISLYEEDMIQREGISLVMENSSPDYVLLLEEEQEKRIKRWEKSVDVKNSLEKNSHVKMFEGKKNKPKKTGILISTRKDEKKVSLVSENGLTIDSSQQKSHHKKTKGSSPCIDLASPEKNVSFNGENEVEPDVESTVSLKTESSISINESELPVNLRSERKYCDFCNVGYTNYFLLEKHKRNCKMDPVNVKTFPRKIFYCRYCYFGITNEEYFKLHESRCQNEQKNDIKPKKPLKRTSVGEPPKFKSKRSKTGKNKCPHCDYTSDSLGHLNQHVRIHSKVPLCICEICDKGFNRISSLRIHMFKHLNLAEEITLVESVEIWEESAKKIVMQVKLNGRNIEIVKYECNKCEFVTTVLFSLEMHMNTMHLKRRVFKCNICPFTSMVKANLRQHLNLHTRERTYKCPKCPYETLNKSYLKKHDNQVHTKAKVFQCNSCEFKCYRQENLNCHVNSMHSKKKRFDCKICRYFSYYQSNLIGHVKTVHQGLNIRKPV